MPTASSRCERCGGSVTGGHADEQGRFSRLCSTCRADAERSLARARVDEDEALALTQVLTTDADVAMLKEGK